MSKRTGKVFIVEQEMVKSAAFDKLTGASPRVMMIFLTKRKMERLKRKGQKHLICTNARELIFTYREAAREFGIRQGRFCRAIDQLVTYGFLDIVCSGAGVKGDATLYGLSDRWRKYGEKDYEEVTRSKEFRGLGFQNPEKRYVPPKKTAHENECCPAHENECCPT